MATAQTLIRTVNSTSGQDPYNGTEGLLDYNGTEGVGGELEYLTGREIAAIIVLSLLVIVTIAGNSLVLAAIFMERSLRIPPNYLIASLAFADLMVAVADMPIRIVFDVTTEWVLGPIMCDIYVFLDVTLCTASILMLCFIALDRYWAITQHVEYTHKRTPKRMWMMIAAAWLASVVISIAPLLGWREKDRDPNQCQISQDKGYTIFSTFGAFFIPMTVMLIVYAKIYKVARSRIRGGIRKKAYEPTPTDMGTTNMGNGGTTAFTQVATSGLQTGRKVAGDKSSKFGRIKKTTLAGMRASVVKNQEEKTASRLANNNSADSPKSARKQNSLEPLGTVVNVTAEMTTTSLTKATKNGKIGSHHNSGGSSPHSPIGQTSYNASETSSSSNQPLSNGVSSPKDGPVKSKSKSSRKERKTDPVKALESQKRQIAVNREKKAAKTLGIVTGTFLVCWLPFFIVALVLPFCQSCAENFPEIWITVLTWLGYFNSMLNPIIYTVYNKDFQRTFKKILLCKQRYRR